MGELYVSIQSTGEEEAQHAPRTQGYFMNRFNFLDLHLDI